MIIMRLLERVIMTLQPGDKDAIKARMDESHRKARNQNNL